MTQRWKAGLQSPMVSLANVKAWSLLNTVRTTSTKKKKARGWEGVALLYYNFPLILDLGEEAELSYIYLKRDHFSWGGREEEKYW